jgi:hypothetical protein
LLIRRTAFILLLAIALLLSGCEGFMRGEPKGLPGIAENHRAGETRVVAPT